MRAPGPRANAQPARPVPVGRRIAVYGPSGSGKTTFAGELATKLGLPCLELDAVFHARPNWQNLPGEEFRQAVRDFLSSNSAGWVVEGNYRRVRDIVLAEAETAIWLDPPFAQVYWQLATRTLTRTFTKAELWGGNRETFRQTFFSRDSMLVWGVTAWGPGRRSVRRALSMRGSAVRVYHLRTRGQVSYLLENVQAVAAASAAR